MNARTLLSKKAFPRERIRLNLVKITNRVQQFFMVYILHWTPKCRKSYFKKPWIDRTLTSASRIEFAPSSRRSTPFAGNQQRSQRPAASKIKNKFFQLHATTIVTEEFRLDNAMLPTPIFNILIPIAIGESIPSFTNIRAVEQACGPIHCSRA